MHSNETEGKHRKSTYTLLILAYISHFVYYFTVFTNMYADVKFLVWIALVAITLGYLLGTRYHLIVKKNRKIVFHNKKLSYNKQKKIAFLFICIGIIAHIFYYRTYKISSYAEGYEVSRGNGYITVLFNFWLVGMIILEYLADNNHVHKRIKWSNRALMLIFVFVYFFILTKRRQIIILVLSLLGIWKDKFTKPQKILLYSLGVAFILIFSIFGKVRGYIDANGFSQGLTYAFNNFSTEWISLENFEGQYISRTLNDTYGYVGLNGHVPSILLGVLFCLVPRKLLGGAKPLSFPEWYTKTFHINDYLRGTGYAGSLIGELYLIGGIAVVIVGFLAVGYISARIQRYREHGSSVKDTLVYSLFLYTMFILPRYDLSSLLMDGIFMYLPIVWFCGESDKKKNT